MTVLRVHSLSVVTILQPVSFQLAAGELCAVVGPNGAGKSSLIQRLSGVLPLDAGQIDILGQSVAGWQAEQWAQRVAYLPQLSQVNFSLSVTEVIALGGLSQAWSQTQRQSLVEESLVCWQLEALAKRDMRSLSGGEQQRVQLARSWVQMQSSSAVLWLLDEPFSALDLRHQALCLDNIQRVQQQGKTVLVVMHDLNIARMRADHVLLLDRGCLVAQGEAQQVLTAEQVSGVFGVTVSEQGALLSWL